MRNLFQIGFPAFGIISYVANPVHFVTLIAQLVNPTSKTHRPSLFPCIVTKSAGLNTFLDIIGIYGILDATLIDILSMCPSLMNHLKHVGSFFRSA